MTVSPPSAATGRGSAAPPDPLEVFATGRSRDLVVSPRGVRFFGRRLPFVAGRSGVVVRKREGDGGTPAGVHRVVGMLYRGDRLAQPTHWARPIGPRDRWCDDPVHPDYNQLVQTPFAASSEALWRSDRLYDLVILTDWNWPDAIPRRGSAIFLHRWRRPGAPTEGCLAFRPDHLLWIARRISLGTRLVIPPQP